LPKWRALGAIDTFRFEIIGYLGRFCLVWLAIQGIRGAAGGDPRRVKASKVTPPALILADNIKGRSGLSITSKAQSFFFRISSTQISIQLIVLFGALFPFTSATGLNLSFNSSSIQLFSDAGGQIAPEIPLLNGSTTANPYLRILAGTPAPTPTPTPGGTPTKGYIPIFYWNQTVANPGLNPAGFANTHASSFPGINILSSGCDDTRVPRSGCPKVLANGYQISGGLGGYVFMQAQNNSVVCPAGSPGGSFHGAFTDLKKTIDTMAANGVKYVVVNEPFDAPCVNDDVGYDPIGPTTTAYNVKGSNIIYDYIHTAHPGMRYGIVSANPNTNLVYLQNGLLTDIAYDELYIETCCGDTSEWIPLKTQFPNVLTATIYEGSPTFCQFSYVTNVNGNPYLDFLMDWNSDLYGGWGYPVQDPFDQLGLLTLAATGAKNAVCENFYSRDRNPTWDTQKGPSFTRMIVDQKYGGKDPITGVAWETKNTKSLVSCDYMVKSGPGGINGPNDPSLVVTRDWTPRPCNSPITITASASGDCRDKKVYPFNGSISGTYLTLRSRQNLPAGAAVWGGNILAGTEIVSGSGTTYQVNQSQTVSSESMQASYGRWTCHVWVRNKMSNGAYGNWSYFQTSISYKPRT